MAEKKEKKPKASVEPEEGLLVSAAKVIGATAGKIAALAGANPDAPPTPPKNPKKPKLAKKHKSRMPRKQKKTLQKAARAKQG